MWSVNMIFDPQAGEQLKGLLESECVYWMMMWSTANHIAASIHVWLDSKNQNQDGVCPSLVGS